MKKVLIISLVLLGITLFFLGVYNFVFKKSTPSSSEPIVQTDPEKNEQEKIIQKKSEKIMPVSKQPVIGKPIFDKKNETITYYSAKDGTVWSVQADGSKESQIADTELAGLKNVFWANGGEKVITEFKKGNNSSFYFYNHKEKKGFPLKDGLDTIAWDSAGTKIFYKYYEASSNKRTLNISNPDGSEWQNLTELIDRDISIAQIPSTSLLSFWNAPKAQDKTYFKSVNMTGGEPTLILSNRFGADYLWAPNGKQALVSSLANSESKMVTLGLVTSEGSYTELNIPTLVSKCVWSFDSKMIYYALPGGIPTNSIMPDDYQNNKFTTEDTFWKINIETGKKERIIETSEITGEYDSSKLFLSANQGYLYFVNRIDEKIYLIRL